MTRAPACAAALAAVMVAPAAARADDKPDPAAVEAGDANLESRALRKGMIFTLGLGGALSVGIGMTGATGQGGAGTLRLAHVANARTMLAVEVVGSALFFNVSEKLYRTDVTNFLISGQYYLNAALWLRGGLGLGRYGGPELRMGDFIARERFRYAGPAGSVGGGVDVVRLKRFRASIEFCSTAMLNRDGVLSSNGFLFGLSID